MTRRPAFYAALAALLVLLWQALTVHFNRQDDWSSLFHTGGFVAMPPAIAPEGTFRFRDEPGYDGQFYHFIAHDPFLRGDTRRFVDNPRLRWRRILVPALAWLLAFGQSDYIDSTYAVVILAFVFLGVYWASAYCAGCALHPAFGLLFLVAPAVLVSIDCFTVDVALAALCCGLAWYGITGPSWRLFAILALSPLARETGVALIAAYVVYTAWRKDWRGVLLGLVAACPYALWLAWLGRHTGPDSTVWASFIPFHGLLDRTLHPVQYALASAWLRIAAILDYLAVLGIWLAVALAARLAWKRRQDLLYVAAILFAAVLVAFLDQKQAWSEASAFARTLSPLLIWLALIGAAERFWQNCLPLAMAAPRLLFQLEPQWHGIVHSVRIALRGAAH
jgi:hypothetical protein